jgi:hypothetical protein
LFGYGQEIKPDYTPDNPNVESLSPGKEWTWTPDEYGTSGKIVIIPAHWEQNARGSIKWNAFMRGDRLLEQAKRYGLENRPDSPPDDATSRTATSPNGDWIWVPGNGWAKSESGGVWSFSEQALIKTKNTDGMMLDSSELDKSGTPSGTIKKAQTEPKKAQTEPEKIGEVPYEERASRLTERAAEVLAGARGVKRADSGAAVYELRALREGTALRSYGRTSRDAVSLPIGDAKSVATCYSRT